MIELSSLEQFEDSNISSLFLPIVRVLKEFFALPVSDRRVLEILSASPAAKLTFDQGGELKQFHRTVGDIANIIKPENRELFLFELPLRLSVWKRLGELSPLQRTKLAEITAVVDPTALVPDSVFGAPRRFADGSAFALAGFPLIGEPIVPVKDKEIGENESMAWEACETLIFGLFIQIPQARKAAERELARGSCQSYYAMVVNNVRREMALLGPDQEMAEAELARRMDISREMLSRMLDPTHVSTHKGRCMFAKALGVPLDRIEPTYVSSFEADWGPKVLSKFDRNVAGVKTEIEWASSRSLHFRTSVDKRLGDSDDARKKFFSTLSETCPNHEPHFDANCTAAPPTALVCACAYALDILPDELWLFSETY